LRRVRYPAGHVAHAHYNETDIPAHLIAVQDAGLQTHLRSLDIKFAQRRDTVAE